MFFLLTYICNSYLWAWEHILIGQPMRTVGRGAFAPPILPPPDVPYGSRWSFDRRTRTLTGSGVGFYRDQFDLLRADQVKASLTSLVTITLRNLLITFSRIVSMGPLPH